MTDTNVIPFPATTLDCDPKRVLKAAINENLEHVVIVGLTKEGETYFVSSTSYFPETLWHLERAKHQLMTMAAGSVCDPNGAGGHAARS